MSTTEWASRPRGKPTIAGRIEARLRHDILHGTLAPGSRLSLDKLREELDVGLSPLREAVTRLVSDGLVEVAPQRGYHVAPISIANYTEVGALRAELEPYALRRSIANGGLDWETDVMAALYRVNHTQRDANDARSRAEWEAANNAFHLALIARCDMPLLLRTHAMLVAFNDRYRNIYSEAVTVQRDVVEEHTAIAQAAVARRADEAAEILELHITRSVEILVGHIKKNMHPEAPGA